MFKTMVYWFLFCTRGRLDTNPPQHASSNLLYQHATSFSEFTHQIFSTHHRIQPETFLDLLEQSFPYTSIFNSHLVTLFPKLLLIIAMATQSSSQRHRMCDPFVARRCIFCRHGYFEGYRQFTVCHSCGTYRLTMSRPGQWNCEEPIRDLINGGSYQYCRHRIGECLRIGGGCRLVNVVLVRQEDIASNQQRNGELRRRQNNNGGDRRDRMEVRTRSKSRKKSKSRKRSRDGKRSNSRRRQDISSGKSDSCGDVSISCCDVM